MNMLSFMIALSLGVLLLSTTASGQILVAKDGSGQFKTIGEAIRFARATGDDIVVKAGEYAENLSIEGRNEINIEAMGDVSIKGSIVSLTKCYRVKFRGFKFSGTISMNECEDMDITACVFSATATALDVKNSLNVGVYGNKFSRSTQEVMVFNDSHNIRISNNVLQDNTGKNGIHLIKSDAVIKNNTIAYNQLTPISIDAGCKAEIFNNIVAFNTINDESAAMNSKSDAYNVKVHHNNLFDNKNKKGAALYSGITPKDDFSSDPLFTDGASRNLAVKNASPCFGTGKDGLTRFGTPIDGVNIGADPNVKGAAVNFEEELEEGIAQFKRRKYDESVTILKKLLQNYPGNADVWNALGTTYLGAKKYDEGISAYQKSVKFRPAEGVAYYNLTCAYSLKGNFPEALGWLEKALKIPGTHTSSIEVDEDITVLRKTPEFKQLLKKYNIQITYWDEK
jgi:tetratricopeptide (TPR) repeat protein